MKEMLLSIALLMAMPVLYAQDKIDAYGKINKADLQMKTCDFDPDASAYCLIDVGEVYYSINRFSADLITNFRRRIKILKQEGNENANIKIHYYSKDSYERVTDVSGIVYNLDDAGNIVTTKLEKSLIYDKKINDRYSEISFALPNVKPGSVLEYKYQTTKKNYSDIDDWYFQSDIPVRYSAYNLVIPQYFDFTYKIIRRQPMEQTKGKTAEEGTWFIMRNIPGLKKEPYMGAYKDYLQRVDFQMTALNIPGEMTINYRTTWDKLAEELQEYEWFGKQLHKNVPGTSSQLKVLLENKKTDREKMDIIYRFVQTNMNWNGQDSRGSYEGIKDAWDKKSGSVGDINLLLANLLKDNGIKAYPLLVSTRDNGRVTTTVPFLDQFNDVYVFAQVENEEVFILNAADKYNPSYLVPYDVQFTNAFLVDKRANRIINIEDLNKKLRHEVSLFMTVADNGSVIGSATVLSFDYGKNIRRKTYKSDGMKDFFAENEGITLNVDSFNVTNEAADTMPLTQKIFFKGEMQQSDDYAFLPYNLFSGLGKNPFIAEKRSSDIDFGFQQSYQITGTYMIPENYNVEELPKNIRMILPDSSIQLTRRIQNTNNIVSFRVTVDFLRPQYEADEYPDVQLVYKKIFEMLNEHIVIKKKKA